MEDFNISRSDQRCIFLIGNARAYIASVKFVVEDFIS